ncbi:hypothetical protein UNPF46_27445 [Bradyrhizobium sp. UNPF46]|nr:hypothetical protein UNPF46_27445 [Bradyrhizobium sp. UNPF46]
MGTRIGICAPLDGGRRKSQLHRQSRRVVAERDLRAMELRDRCNQAEAEAIARRVAALLRSLLFIEASSSRGSRPAARCGSDERTAPSTDKGARF